MLILFLQILIVKDRLVVDITGVPKTERNWLS